MIRQDLHHTQQIMMQHIKESSPVLRDLRDWMITEKSNAKRGM